MAHGTDLALVRFAKLLILLVLAGCLVATVPLLLGGVQRVYALFPETPSDRYKTFASLSGTVVAIISVLAAVVTFWLSARATRKAQRKQHTITLLLEMRLSETFQTTNKLRKIYYPTGKDIDPGLLDDAYTSDYATEPSTALAGNCKRSGAEALVTLLNYYEFLAVGIMQRDLDETMLRETLRGIMCRLVDDARLTIHADQLQNPRTYRNLAWLYARWRDPLAVDAKGKPNERPIGPAPDSRA